MESALRRWQHPWKRLDRGRRWGRQAPPSSPSPLPSTARGPLVDPPGDGGTEGRQWPRDGGACAAGRQAGWGALRERFKGAGTCREKPCGEGGGLCSLLVPLGVALRARLTGQRAAAAALASWGRRRTAACGAAASPPRASPRTPRCRC